MMMTSHEPYYHWSDDERKATSSTGRPKRRAPAPESPSLEAEPAFDIFKMLRELREEELERMCSRPKHWPKERYISYTFEPMPSQRRLPQPPPQPPPQQQQQQQQQQPKGNRRGGGGGEDVLSNTATTLYGVAVADKVMRHAYS